MASKITVLAGDLVKSTQMDSESIAHAFDTLKHVANQIAEWHFSPTCFTRNRGDGWQLCLPKGAFGKHYSFEQD